MKLRSCSEISVINRGHLNRDGQKTAMVARCFLSPDHEGSHRFSYEHILDEQVDEWRRKGAGMVRHD